MQAVELSEDQKSKLRDTFNYFDKDSSGRIDRKELRETLKKLGDFCEMDIIQILTNADDDASGDLDFNEFCAKVAPKFFNLKKLNPADVEKAFEVHHHSQYSLFHLHFRIACTSLLLIYRNTIPVKMAS